MGLWLTNCFLIVSFMCVFKAIEVISGRTLWDDCRKGISTDLNLCSVKLYQLSLHIYLLHSIIEKYDNVHDSQFFSKKEGEREGEEEALQALFFIQHFNATFIILYRTHVLTNNCSNCHFRHCPNLGSLWSAQKLSVLFEDTSGGDMQYLEQPLLWPFSLINPLIYPYKPI